MQAAAADAQERADSGLVDSVVWGGQGWEVFRGRPDRPQ